MTVYKYEFKVTIKQQLILLIPAFALYLGLIIIGVYVLRLKFDGIVFWSVFCFLFLIDTLPTIIVHFQYWIKNSSVTLVVNTEKGEIEYVTPGQKISYSFSDIATLNYYRSYGKGSGWHSFGQYRYYKIIFKDKTEIDITCLMINNIENTLEMLLRTSSEKHFKLLCLIT